MNKIFVHIQNYLFKTILTNEIIFMLDYKEQKEYETLFPYL
jgi:hypothetical protein